MFWFALASMTPALLLMIASVQGGIWPLLALAYIAVFVVILDRIPGTIPAMSETQAARRGANILSLVLGIAHFAVLPLGVWAVALAPFLNGVQSGVLGVALGLFLGQVSHPNAHELIHAPGRGLRKLGKAIYISLLFGHHASAHPKVHHVFVASDRDPNSAPSGEGFYHFLPRAWLGSFWAGYRAENAARARQAIRPSRLSHPYVAYCGGAAAALGFAYALAGARGVLVYLGLAAFAQTQLLLAEYVQHYGLRRRRLADGSFENAGPQHAWNAPHWFSAAMMLNAPRHSDHHMNPMRPFPALRLDPVRMPVLPYSMPLMAAMALYPPLWRRVMNPRATRWAAVAGGTGHDQGADK